MKTIRFGVIGCGFFGGEFARILHRMEGTEVTALYNGPGGAAALSAELGCPVEVSLEGLVGRADVDAVIVASPNDKHKEAALAAARAGKHIFCEKPAALTLEDGRAMVEAARVGGVQLMAGHILHFFSGIEQVKRWLADGEIGRLVVCQGERTGWERRAEEVSWKKQQNRSGGHLFHHIHELDLALALMGEPTKVGMFAGNLAHQGEGWGDEDDVLLLHLQFASGALCSLHYGSGFHWGAHDMRIGGTEGAIRIDFKQSTVELRKEGQSAVTRPLHDDPQENAERIELYRRMDGGVIYGDPQLRPPKFLQTPMRKELECFCEVLRGGLPSENKARLFDGSAALQSLAAAETALQASRNERICHFL